MGVRSNYAVEYRFHGGLHVPYLCGGQVCRIAHGTSRLVQGQKQLVKGVVTLCNQNKSHCHHREAYP